MDHKPERCTRCGSLMKPLFHTDYYCEFCERPENKEITETYAFTLLNPEWLSIAKEAVVPAGTKLDLFKFEEEARYVADALLNSQLALVKITFESGIKWASIFGSNPHILQRDTPFSIIGH